MEFWLLTPLLFVSGYLLGRWHNRHWRRDRVVALHRKLQLIAERIENQGMRHKRKRPSLKPWQKWLLGLLHWWSPTLTRYTLFRPETPIGWFNRYVRCYSLAPCLENRGLSPIIPFYYSATLRTPTS